MDIFSEFKDLQKLYNNIIVDRFNDAPFSESFECIYDVIEYSISKEHAGELCSELMDAYNISEILCDNKCEQQ